jgi:ATP-dependent RNA helicase DeaD
MTAPTFSTFAELNLSPALLKVLSDVGYESPSPIQAATIPHLLAGRDLIGQAQTGTGKTAAFALPILNRLDMQQKTPQTLVLAPTRELAIQVAEAFQRYAAHMPGFHVLPIYGGQSYQPQLAGLKRGAHVVVGTPGRIMDHLERGSLDLSHVKYFVLDEADEMLRMGFIDDVETILGKAPASKQVALFSATMPAPIRRIAQAHLKDPVEVAIQSKTATATHIRQRYWLVSGLHKLDALTRILEAETFEAMIIFSRTKQATEELAEKLQARGFSAAAINGDIAQAQRERTIQRLKDGQIDILVATDVAARGLDVERVSHVLNFDIPYDPESYVHRIGRTGRAGRAGDAILFVTPRERNMLRVIERTTRQPITAMELPTVDVINDKRIDKFKQRIVETIAAGELNVFQHLIEQFERETNTPALEIAAALAKLLQGDVPLLLDAKAAKRERDDLSSFGRDDRPERSERARSPFERPERGSRPDRGDRPERTERFSSFGSSEERPARAPKRMPPREPGMERFRLEVGFKHGVKPGNIVGAIANEAGVEARDIGRIEISDTHALIDLPEGMPNDVFKHLQKVWVSGQQLRISKVEGDGEGTPSREPSERRGPPARRGPPVNKRPRE